MSSINYQSQNLIMTQFKNTFLILAILVITLVFTSCTSEELANPKPEFSDDEIMAMLQSDVTSRSNGMVFDIQQFVEELIKIIDDAELCEAPYEFNFDERNVGDFFDVSYKGQVNGEVTCLGNLPIAATVFATSSSRLAPVSSEGVISTGESDFAGNVAAFFDPIRLFPLELETGVNFSGNYNRIGTSKAINNPASSPQEITTNLTIDLSEFRVTVLPEADIDAGIGTLTYTGSVDGDEVYALNGSLVFNGDKTVILTVNGEEFPWSWE